MAENFFLLIFVLSFTSAHLLNYISYFCRISGCIIGYPLLGTSLGSLLNGFSQLSMLFFLPILAFLIETKFLNFKEYLFYFFLNFTFTVITMAFLFFKKERLIEIFCRILLTHTVNKKNLLLSFIIFFKYKFDNNLSFKLNKKNFFEKKILISSIIAYLALSSGFFIAFYFVILFPEFRLTVSTISLIIHAFGNFILLTYIDPKLNLNIDKIKIIGYEKSMHSFFVSRIISLSILSSFSLILLSIHVI
jgi:hypothetical protein